MEPPWKSVRCQCIAGSTTSVPVVGLPRKLFAPPRLSHVLRTMGLSCEARAAVLRVAASLVALPTGLVDGAVLVALLRAVTLLKVSVVEVGDVDPDVAAVAAHLPLHRGCRRTAGHGLERGRVSHLDQLVGWLGGDGGAAATVREAALLVALPTRFVKTARYRLPFCVTVTLLKVSVPDVAPATSTQVLPPSPLSCHCTEVAGVPVAAA